MIDSAHKKPAFYFYGRADDLATGANRDRGQYYFDSDFILKYKLPNNPWENISMTTLCPQSANQDEGEAILHQKGGWTMIAFWDRSNDHRLNSSGAFLTEGSFSFEAMRQLAEEHFPKLVQRINKKLGHAGKQTLQMKDATPGKERTAETSQTMQWREREIEKRLDDLKNALLATGCNQDICDKILSDARERIISMSNENLKNAGNMPVRAK